MSFVSTENSPAAWVQTPAHFSTHFPLKLSPLSSMEIMQMCNKNKNASINVVLFYVFIFVDIHNNSNVNLTFHGKIIFYLVKKKKKACMHRRNYAKIRQMRGFDSVFKIN